jgi:hypothetical protein
VKSSFIDLYGKPHSHRREEIFEQGLAETLDWSGDTRWIRLIDFPGGNKPRFHLQPSLKRAQVQASLELGVLPPREPPKIGIEHHESKLVLLLPDGSALDYPRLHHPAITLNCSWQQNADGIFVYNVDLDTTTLSSICIGERSDGGIAWHLLSEPDDWSCLSRGRTWFHRGVPKPELARFSIESAKLPGPVPLYVSTKDALKGGVSRDGVLSIPVTLPRRVYDAVGKALVGQMTFLNNRFVIGPAIPRGSKESALRLLTRMWVDKYGFGFLEPILDNATALSVGVDQLRPNSMLEEQIVDCLRGALRGSPGADT